MIAQLAELSQAAAPTAFHQVLKTLDDRGKLLRVYTQNIDAIEQKCGLSFGIPAFEDKRVKNRSKGAAAVFLGEQDCSDASSSGHQTPNLPGNFPRTIPLHGTLQTLHCQICTHAFPLQEYMRFLAVGQPPQCPECASMEATRQLIGKRARGIGRLRPSVVLYNEDHKDGEGVGEVVRKDLMGASKGKGRSGADLLLVVGTSLRVPGTKRMVREFSKAVRSRGTGSPNSSGHPSPAPSPGRSSSSEEEPSIKAIYLNLDFPVPTREWEGVFDTWIQGDAQQFAEMLQAKIGEELEAKEIAIERKRKREEEAIEKERVAFQEPMKSKKGGKRKGSESPVRAAKRRKVYLPPTPPKSPTPAKGKDKGKHPDESPKFLLRIPPRRTFLIPEVYITTPAPSKMIYVKRRPPITPEPSPCPRPRLNSRTKAGRKAIRLARSSRSTQTTGIRQDLTISSPASQNTPSDEDEDVDVDDAHCLPDSFVRTVQYGLRGSGD
jgi:NAD-dependent SIR2 family protein deacetylase